MTISLPLIVALGAIIAVLAIMQRARYLAQPLRLRMAAVGEDLLADPKMSQAAKDQVRFYLDRAFGMRLELLLLYVLTIFYAPVMMLNRTPRGLCDGAPASTQKRFEELCNLFVVIMFANNPIMSSVLMIEMRALTILCAPFVILFQKALPRSPRILAALKPVTRKPHITLPHLPALG